MTSARIPSSWRSTTRALRADVPASLVVFVVAVPLSLGIAVASGAPLAAGLIACVVGGVVGGALGGSPLQISGPAAGLTVIVSTLVQTYGWRATCSIVVAAGLVQLLLGVCRVARVALAVSPAVVRGMLAGVGVVIVLAQLHVVLGGGPQPSALRNLLALPGQIAGVHTHAVAVGLVTIGVMLGWPRLPRPLRGVPGPLAAIAVSALTAWLFGWDVALVDLPHRPLDVWAPPLLPQGDVVGVAGAVLTVALVGAAESLLCAMAVDRMRADPGPASDLNRELIGQGGANMVSGILGGLPVAGVIVRSTMNVRAGARTRASSILHGVWVLAMAVAFTPLVERIPLASLAGLLVVVGCRMLEIAHIQQLHSHREVPVYLVTLVGVVLAGLAEGVVAGIAMAAFMALRRLTRLSVRVRRHHPHHRDHWHVEVTGSLTFLGVPHLLRELRAVPPRTHVHLELNLDFMDNAGFEAIHSWGVRHHNQGGTVDIDDVHDDWYTRAADGASAPARKTAPQGRWWSPWPHRPTRPDPHTGPDHHARPGPPPDRLIEGTREFQHHPAPRMRPLFADLPHRHTPTHLFITCADARIVPNLITASGPGDLFTVRNLGNLVPRHGARPATHEDTSVAAAIEYAIDVLGVSTITVCGHSGCGAMSALLEPTHQRGDLPWLKRWLEHGKHSLARHAAATPAGSPAEPPDRHCQTALTTLCKSNVTQQLDNLLTHPRVRELTAAGRLRLVGLYFDLHTATVAVLDQRGSHSEPPAPRHRSPA